MSDIKRYIGCPVILRYRDGRQEVQEECTIEHATSDQVVINKNSDHTVIDINQVYGVRDYSYFEEMAESACI